MGWNFGDVLEAIEPVLAADKPAIIHCCEDGTERIVSHGDAMRRSNNLARALRDLGAETGDKVAFYMRNCPEYVEGLGACFKARLTHVNVNYRYRADELHYIFDNSDSVVILYTREFADQVADLKDKLDKVKIFIEINADGPVNDFALDFEGLAEKGDGQPLRLERSNQDLVLLYTGGTTGMPKGVMWPHDTLNDVQIGQREPLGLSTPTSLEDYADILTREIPDSVLLPACPLMHGTGLLTSIGAMMAGNAVLTLESRSFSAPLLWASCARHGVTNMAIVGDAFGRPLLNELQDNPGKYDLGALRGMLSSGVMWSRENKLGLIEQIPQVILSDGFSASEGLGFGLSVMAKGVESQTAKFTIGPNCKVFDEDDREVVPGSGEQGFIALRGTIPLGYYKDEEKTASTFRTIEGVRYSIPGDYCMVEEDGSLVLLGRGSVCINSGGEKIFPEEIEEVLKRHENIRDALVVGVPDDRFGQKVVAVAEPFDGKGDEAEMINFVREHLADYKAPRHILFKDDIGRAPNGKADYKGVTEYAVATL